MLRVNDVLAPHELCERPPLGEPMVVVWADPPTERLAAINLRGRARRPVLYPYPAVLAWLEEQLITRGELQVPSHFDRDDAYIKPKSRRTRDRRFAAIRPIVEDLEAFLVPTYGANLVARCAAAADVTRNCIYQWLYTYLRGGQMRAALLPAYGNSGTGKRTAGRKKLGRPRRNSPYRGMNMTPEDIKRVRRVLKKKYCVDGGYTLTGCYHFLLRIDYASKTYNAKGEVVHKPHHPDRRPSWDQFYEHAKQILNELGHDVDRTRVGKADYDKDRAGRRGTAPRPTGPGHVYQLDATTHDLHIVSPLCSERTLRVGRVTLYVVVDVYSGMIVGLHLTLSEPSWAAARIALFNAFRRKKEYVAELGIEIDESDWPVNGICRIVCVDNAELQNSISEPGVQDLGYSVVFARAWRGDDKGHVERLIGLLNQRAAGLPGYVRKHRRTRGRRDPRRDAAVTMRELYQQLIREVLHRNNAASITEDYLTAPMAKDGVQAVSRDIWLWGERHRPALRKGATDAQLYLKLLEKGTATIHRNGIYFNGRWYRSQWTLAQGLQERKPNRNKAGKIGVRFMRHNINTILLVAPDGSLYKAELQERSQRFRDCFEDEVEERLNAEKYQRNAREPEATASRIAVEDAKDELAAKARKEQRRLPGADVRRQDVRAQRGEALELEHRDEAGRYERCIDEVYGGGTRPTSAPEDTADAADDLRRRAHDEAMARLLKDDTHDDDH